MDRPSSSPRLVLAGVVVTGLVLGLLVMAPSGPDPRGTRAARSQPRPATVEVLGRRTQRPAPASIPTSTSTSPPVPVVTPTSVPVTPVTVATPTPVTMSCADVLAYLRDHQAPGFTDVCADGSAIGHFGFTCVNQPGMCEGQRFIHIACPAMFVVQNEAHNSWVLLGERTGIDPYGQGTAAEQEACDRHR